MGSGALILPALTGERATNHGEEINGEREKNGQALASTVPVLGQHSAVLGPVGAQPSACQKYCPVLAQTVTQYWASAAQYGPALPGSDPFHLRFFPPRSI